MCLSCEVVLVGGVLFGVVLKNFNNFFSCVWLSGLSHLRHSFFAPASRRGVSERPPPALFPRQGGHFLGGEGGGPGSVRRAGRNSARN